MWDRIRKSILMSVIMNLSKKVAEWWWQQDLMGHSALTWPPSPQYRHSLSVICHSCGERQNKSTFMDSKYGSGGWPKRVDCRALLLILYDCSRWPTLMESWIKFSNSIWLLYAVKHSQRNGPRPCLLAVDTTVKNNQWWISFLDKDGKVFIKLCFTCPVSRYMMDHLVGNCCECILRTR